MNEHLTDAEVIDYVRHELDADADARLHAHLAVCDACRLAVEREGELSDWIRAAAAAETRELPTSIIATVRQQTRSMRVWRFPALAEIFRPTVVMPATAVLLVVWKLATMVPHGPAQSAAIDVRALAQIHAVDAAHAAFADRSVPGTLEGAASDEGTPAQSAFVPPIVADFEVAP